MTNYLFPTAAAVEADKILVVGDFGYWEHTADGVAFLNAVDCLAYDSGIPLYWLHGNHDKWSLAMSQYGERRDDEGFVICRERVLYIPQGHAWSWGGAQLRSFGGAWSVDKVMRLALEQRKYEQLVRSEQFRASKRNRQPVAVPSQAETLWFPEEQMSDEQMHDLLAADSASKDVIFSHDKPLSAKPGWNRKDFDDCLPNQGRLEAALRVHEPRFWLHGHLHHYYRYTNPHTRTQIIGLDPDERAAEPGWKFRQTWALLDMEQGLTGLTLGPGATVDKAKLAAAKARIY